MSFLKKYKTDKTAEENGVWVSLSDETSVKVARANCKAAVELRKRLEKPYQNFTTVPDKVMKDIAIKVAAQVLVKDWKGVTDENEVEIPFSPETAEKIFTDVPDFLNDIYTIAVARETFQNETVEVVKNA